jgi:hypothetical protein
LEEEVSAWVKAGNRESAIGNGSRLCGFATSKVKA